jgi:hypothetical protein
MESEDLMNVMMSGQTGLAWAQSFRRARIRLLTSDDPPFHLVEGCALFLHVIPFGARLPITFRESKVQAAVRGHGSFAETNELTYNADGLMRYSMLDGGKISSYLLYLRCGMIEQCTIYHPTGEKMIPGLLLDRFVAFNLTDDVEALVALDETFPMVIFATLVGAKGWSIAGEQAGQPIDRDIVWIEGLELRDNQNEAEQALRPLIDGIWNCSGMARSPYVGRL